MHIDYLNGRLALVGGGCLSIHTMQVLNQDEVVSFTLSEILIPRGQVTAVRKPPNTMHLRTAHLSEKGLVVVSFVENDTAGSNSQM
jgi:hypothetical protein